jgi:hypothetical protein
VSEKATHVLWRTFRDPRRANPNIYHIPLSLVFPHQQHYVNPQSQHSVPGIGSAEELTLASLFSFLYLFLFDYGQLARG